MNLRDAILALLEDHYELTAADIQYCVTMRTRTAYAPAETHAAIDALVAERWLVRDDRMAPPTYRRRTQAQWDALQAALNPNQGSLL